MAKTTEAEEFHVTKAFVGTNSEPSNIMLFYNPGKGFDQMVPYDHPYRIKQDKRDNQPAYQPVSAKAQSFFEVPAAVTVVSADHGIEETVAIPSMFDNIMKLGREIGYVLVESKSPRSRRGDPQIKSTMAEAKRFGDALHEAFCANKVNEWLMIVDRAKQAGVMPQPAEGLFKYCLNKLHMQDPADRVETLQAARADAASRDDMQKQIDELKALLLAKAV